MLDSKKKREGFTLVEILIVMMIVGILSTLAINGYTEYRKSTLLELTADNMVSQILQLRDRAIHGNFGSDERVQQIEDLLNLGAEDSEIGVVTLPPVDGGSALCFGVEFGSGEVTMFRERFSGQKEFAAGGWKYVGCDNTGREELGGFELDSQVVVEKIVLLGEQEGDEKPVVVDFSMRFVPPSGDLEVFADGDEIDLSTIKKVQIQIRYGTGDQIRFKRKIIFDFDSLTAKTTNVE